MDYSHGQKNPPRTRVRRSKVHTLRCGLHLEIFPAQAGSKIHHKKKAHLVPWVFIIFYNYRCLSNQQVYWLVASIVTLQVGRNTILNVKVSKKHSSQSHRNVTEGTTNGSEVPSVLSHWKLGKITMVIKQLLQTKTCLYYLYITYESHDCGWFQWTPRQPIEDMGPSW